MDHKENENKFTKAHGQVLFAGKVIEENKTPTAEERLKIFLKYFISFNNDTGGGLEGCIDTIKQCIQSIEKEKVEFARIHVKNFYDKVHKSKIRTDGDNLMIYLDPLEEIYSLENIK